MKKIKKIVIASVFLSVTMAGVKAQDSANQKIPFDGIETNWQNGSDRRDSSVFHGKYFIPTIILDLNYTHSFNNPNDNPVVGSTVLSRNNEVQLSHLLIGGDFVYKNAHARVMLQYGARSIVIPRND